MIFFLLQVNNKLLFSSSSDKTIRSWVVEFGDCTRVFKGHTHTVGCLAVEDGLGMETKHNALSHNFKIFHIFKVILVIVCNRRHLG